jgi:hypothetical protein
MDGRDLPGAVWRRGCEDMVVVVLLVVVVVVVVVVQACVCCGRGVEWLGLESSVADVWKIDYSR